MHRNAGSYSVVYISVSSITISLKPAENVLVAQLIWPQANQVVTKKYCVCVGH